MLKFRNPVVNAVNLSEDNAADLSEDDETERDRWVDVPREDWISCPIVEMLPEERQKYWQQRNMRKYGGIRLSSVSSSVIEAEVFAQTMGRLAAALDKLERKL